MNGWPRCWPWNLSNRASTSSWATRNGLVKKTEIMAYSRPRSVGIIALDLVPGDELIAARITDGTCNVFLGSANGKSIRFHEADVRTAGRVSRGVRGLRLDSGDRIVGMEVLTHGQTLFVVTENGYGKRTAIERIPGSGTRRQGRDHPSRPVCAMARWWPSCWSRIRTT